MASARSARRRFPLPRGGHPLSRPPPQMLLDPLPLLMPEGGVARRLLSAPDETPERVWGGGRRGISLLLLLPFGYGTKGAADDAGTATRQQRDRRRPAGSDGDDASLGAAPIPSCARGEPRKFPRPCARWLSAPPRVTSSGVALHGRLPRPLRQLSRFLCQLNGVSCRSFRWAPLEWDSPVVSHTFGFVRHAQEQ
ncbi:hypothetical protein MTO96_004366 [Rhipicephalus appendiculatus]